MKLRCYFNRHPWNYRTFGDVVIRLCKNGCNGPQCWANGQWKPLRPLPEKKALLPGGIYPTLRVTPGTDARLTDLVWSDMQSAPGAGRVKVGRRTADI